MLRFVYDNDALGHLVARPDYPVTKDLILQSIARRINAFYYPYVNFIELVKGTSANSFLRTRALLQEAYEISGDGHVLLMPPEHLRYSIHAVANTEYAEACRDLLREMRHVVTSQSYDEYLQCFRGKSEYIQKFVAEMEAFYTASTQRLRPGMQHANSNERRLLDNSKRARFQTLFLKGPLERFKLEEVVEGWHPEAIERRLPSVLQFLEIYRVLLRKRLFQGKKCKGNDYFDLERVIYLDLCDYIVSDDKGFRALFNEAKDLDLYARAISLDKLIEHLESPCLVSRTTSAVYDQASDVWVGI